MKKLIILLLLLLPIVFAQDSYNQGASTTAGGHTVKIVMIGQNSVVFDVDGVKNVVSLNQEKIINSVRITVTEIFYTEEVESRYTKALMEAVGEAVGGCGDGTCSGEESETTCCKDCGCSAVNYTCAENACLKNECMDDEECWDQNYCDRDKCEGTPKKCTHTPILDCVVNDKCCPSSCYYPDDPDCPTDKINPSKPAESKNVTEAKVESVKEEKVGFFKRIITWILRLFGR